MSVEFIDVCTNYLSQNQESSSEDMMHVYALKMWGRVTGDAALESRYGEPRMLYRDDILRC
jgi:endoglucanase Acf2